MRLPGILHRFAAKYRLPMVDRAKLFGLYPLFKLHHWYCHGSPGRQRFATRLFDLLRGAPPITLSMYFPARRQHVAVPVWFVPDRVSTFQEIFWSDSYALPQRWAPHVLVDAGANVGYATLYFAAHQPLRRALMIEANPELLPCLDIVADQLRKCGVEVQIASGALVGTPRDVGFTIRHSSRDSGIDDPDSPGETERRHVRVRGLRFAEWVQLYGLTADEGGSVLLKMDIEGAEHEMMSDDPEAFRAVDLLVAEIHGGEPARDRFALGLTDLCNVSILERRTSEACSEVELAFGEQNG